MSYREQWQHDGYLVLRNVFDTGQIARLFEIAESAYADWKENSTAENQPDRYAYAPQAWSLLHLNHSKYHQENPDTLRVLLDAIANPWAMQITRDIFQEEPAFMQANLYIDPPGESRPTHWHRDSQFYAAGDEEKERRMVMEEADPPRELHMHIPLVPTAASEVIPGSHRRWDTPEENRIRREDQTADYMPGAVRLKLEPGDLAFFHVNSLHRGIYPHGVPRRTIAVTFSRRSVLRKATAEWMKAWRGYVCTYQPWMQNPEYLNGVAKPTRELFEHFIEDYQGSWDPAFLEELHPDLQAYFRDYAAVIS